MMQREKQSVIFLQLLSQLIWSTNSRPCYLRSGLPLSQGSEESIFSHKERGDRFSFSLTNPVRKASGVYYEYMLKNWKKRLLVMG